MFLVAELPQKDERLLELLDCQSDAAGMNESKSQVVARQRLGPPVTELTDDLERGQMLLGRLFAIAFPSKLRPERLQPTRFAVQVGAGWFPSDEPLTTAWLAETRCSRSAAGAGRGRAHRAAP